MLRVSYEEICQQLGLAPCAVVTTLSAHTIATGQGFLGSMPWCVLSMHAAGARAGQA